MTFAWPWMLLLLGVVPLLVVEYRRLLRRRELRRAELAAVGLVSPAAAGLGRRRHAGPLLHLAAVAVLAVALARPEASVAHPRREGTVVLAVDVSGSMAATDLAPTRMEAAKAAARTFVQHQPASIRLAVVAFGQSGVIVQQPTTDRTAVLAAIDRLSPQGGTALGRGIQTSLSAIAGRTVQLTAPGSPDPSSGGSGSSLEPVGPDLGYHGSAAVVLFTDGENTADPDPIGVADAASTAGVRIYPIGLGSARGTVLRIDGFQVATALDEPLLRQIASRTGGTYYAAADQQSLAGVYDAINLTWAVRTERIEITALFAGLAALLLLLGSGLTFVRVGRVV